MVLLYLAMSICWMEAFLALLLAFTLCLFIVFTVFKGVSDPVCLCGY